MNEETIVRQMQERFGLPAEAVKIQRARRVTIEVPQDRFDEIFAYTVRDLDFTNLCTMTGLDEGDRYAFIYHLAAKDNRIVLNLKTFTPRDGAEIHSVTGFFPSAEMYEREVSDLLGVTVTGLQEGRRYPLPDNWPDGQHPLRKEWGREPASEK